MRILEQIKAAFRWNGHAEAKAKPEIVVVDDEETKMIIELDADAAEAQLEAVAAEQKKSATVFGTETVNLREQFLEILESEGKDDERIPTSG